jgi:hypothetical protein
MRVQLGDLLREGLLTAGYRAHGEAGGRLYVFWILAGAEAGGSANELFGREPAQAVAQWLRGRHHEALELVRGLTAGLYRRLAGQSQGLDHLCPALAALGLSGHLAGQYRSSGGLRVDGIGTAARYDA